MSADASGGESSHSVTRYLADLRTRDAAAAGEIWNRYVKRLLPLARAKLRGMPQRGLDEEDILVSVFDRFFRAAAEDRFARLDDRDDLWQILVLLTERRVADEYRRAAAQKRGGTGTGAPHPLADTPVSNVADTTPGPAFLAAFNDSLACSLERLPEGPTREVALLRMEGYEVREIAERLEISVSSVERKLRVVREAWEETFS